MWHFRHQHGIGALLVGYQLGTVNTVNMFSSKILSEIISGKQINALPKIFLTFSGFKTILHTVLFFLSLIYFSDLFFFLEEKVFCQKLSLES